MKHAIAALTLILACGLFGAFHLGPSAAPDADAAVITPDTAAVPGTVEPGASTQTESCDQATLIEDNAACAGDLVGTCCYGSGRYWNRYRVNGVTKCCGACFQ